MDWRTEREETTTKFVRESGSSDLDSYFKTKFEEIKYLSKTNKLMTDIEESAQLYYPFSLFGLHHSNVGHGLLKRATISTGY